MIEFKRATPTPIDPSQHYFPLLTLSQVAELLTVQPSTVLHWVRNGRLKAFKIGKSWRVRESDVEAFLERCEFNGNE